MGRLRTTPRGGSRARRASSFGHVRLAAAVVVALGAFAVVLVGYTAAAPAALPTLSLLDVSTPEGAINSVHAVSVPVTLSATSTSVVTVAWKTADGSARGSDPDLDYYASNGILTFAPGETSKSIDILIDGGNGPETDESFTVELSDPVNATIEKGVATVSILNDDVPPPPDPGEVNVIPTDGGGQCIALLTEPGCRPLEYGEQLPIDEIKYINPRSSKVTLRSIAGIGTFYGGRFSVTEIGDAADARTASAAAAKPVLVVNLVGGSFKACSKTRALSGVEAKKKPVRQLWGKGKGRFRTRGRYASGTVRGTNWVTQDFCNGTAIRVVSGVVQVRDFVTKKILLLKRGQTHFAKAPTG